MNKILITLVLPLIFIGCSAITGEEIARLEINKVSTSGNFTADEVTLELKKGDEITFWSDIDLAYDGGVETRFKVKIYKGDNKTKEININPIEKSISIGEVKTVLNNNTKWSFTGKNSSYTADADASYTFKSIFVASNNPSLIVKKAELVLKK